MSDERSEGFEGGEKNSGARNLLDAFDRVIASLPPGDPIRRELLDLRPEISEHEETIVEARRMIEKLEEVIKKVTSPANRIGTFLGATSRDTAHIVVGGADYYCNVDPRIPLEMLARTKSHEHYLDVVPELPWGKVGGQEAALQAIKDAIELPLLHVDLFKKFQHVTPKGFLLYGPPGCGKTLIGKATAYNLTKQLREKTGAQMKEYFMHVKGPEILNMWVGESERMVREIFATAREKRRDGFMPFLFIDEAESILGTRRASRYSNILSTLVPMFCAEMDGIDSLNDVVIILASNRADLIDPAILRPGRIDRKIKVNRPNRAGTRDIYRIYLTNDLPYDGALAKEAENIGAAIERLIERFVDWQFTRRDENRFLEVTLRSGRKEMLYRSDLISGAIIASIVERAKAIAIKRAIATQQPEGIRETDLQLAFNAEYVENDIFPSSDVTEDWLKLIDYEPENVVKIAPVRPLGPNARPTSRSGVI